MSHDRFHRACGHLWGVRVGALCLFLASPALAMASDKAAGPKPPSAPQPASQAQVVAAYGKLPLSFEANQGQTDPRVKFLSRGRGYALFLTGNEAVLSLRKPSAGIGNSKLENRKPGIGRRGAAGADAPDSSLVTRHLSLETEVLRLRLTGANPAPEVRGLDELPGKSNYFLGKDPKQWRTNVPNYAKVAYKNVYPGVDLVYYGNQGQLEYDFVVAPGADPKVITLEIETGNSKLETRNSKIENSQSRIRNLKSEIAANGDLVIATEGGEVRFHKPLVYQRGNPKSQIPNRQFLDACYVLRWSNPKSKIENPKYEIAFEIAKYDASRPLIIDPVLSYSTFLGASDQDYGTGIAVDSSGNAYVAGFTFSTDFPVYPLTNPLQPTSGGGYDVFVTKLNAAGTGLEYSTYLGGAGDEMGFGLALDSSGNAYVTGFTYSDDFPVTQFAFQTSCSFDVYYPCSDAFVTKLNSAGNGLSYSTFLGGSARDSGVGIALDSAGNAYVAGYTDSTDFPLAVAFQASNRGGRDAFVTKLNTDGSAPVYSTYLGGGGDDSAYGIRVDSSDNAYVAGRTASSNFPTASPLQAALRGLSDAFVTKFNATGSSLVYSTYLGGSSDDQASGIAVDSSGSAYLTGDTGSPDFPTTPGAFDTSCGTDGNCNGGVADAFVTKLNAAGSALVYATYLGSTGGEWGSGITVDASGNAYVVGGTNSADFPVTAGAFQTTFGGGTCGGGVPGPCADAFMTKLNATGSALIYSTYLGSNNADNAAAIGVDASRHAYIAGYTYSSSFPTTTGAYDTTCGTDGACNAGAAAPLPDAFVAKLSGLALPVVTLSPTSLDFGEQLVGTTSAPRTVTLTNNGDAPLTFTSFNVQRSLTDQTASPDFTEFNDCGGPLPLAAGASCTLTVLFAPTAIGTRTAVLVIVDNAAGSPHSVDLTGVGLGAPAVTLSTSDLDFGNQPVGSTSAPKAVSLTNTGTAALTISSITTPADFAQTNDCGALPAILGVGGSCTIGVTFTPSAEGFVIDFLSITDNASDSPQSVTLSGKGVPNPVPQINQPVVPASAVPGGADFTLTVNGTGFSSGSVVNWDGSARTTTFVSNTQLTATIPASDIATAGTAWVTVVNPTPGGGTSNVAFFPITNPTSSVTLSRTDFATGSGPYAVATGDFNADGKLDLAVANHQGNSVSILLGKGDGTFQSNVDYATGQFPYSVAVGDFNGDGKPDLAVADYYPGDSISILLGNGDGTFQGHVDYPTSPDDPYGTVVADFNGDGMLDLATTNMNGDAVSVFLGNGNGTFQAHVDYPTHSNSGGRAIVAEDFNGDGKLDLATADDGSNTVSILLGNADGTFPSTVQYPAGNSTGGLAAADFNGDGKVDLATANENGNTISVLLGNGDGTFQGHVDYATGSGPFWVAAGDLNGDGVFDLVVSNVNDDTVSVLLGNGDGTFQTHLDFTTGSSPRWVATGDFNGDGRLDLAVVKSAAVSVLLQAPAASLSSSSLTFGNQLVGTTSAPKSVTLTNTGSAALAISTVTLAGAHTGDYTMGENCSGATLAPAATCTIGVTFSPTAIGSRTATITITDNDNNVVGATQTISLDGTGVTPVVSLSATSLTFTSQLLGSTSAPQAVTLTNNGNAPLTISRIVVTGDFALTHNCPLAPATLAAVARCTINVTFTPTAAGARGGAVTITDNASGSPHTVSLTGTGIGPAVSLSPTSLSFGNQPVGATSAAQTVTLTNSGTNTLNISSILTGGDFAQTNNCGASLAPAASCAIRVTFTPAAAGSRAGTLTIADNASGSPHAVALSGTGIQPAVGLVPTALAFGNQRVGTTSSAQTVALTNSGAATLNITSVGVTGDFVLAATTTCPSSGTVAAGASCSLDVTFTPTATGARTGTVSITSDAPGSPHQVALSGTGIVGPAVSLSPTSLSFGNQLVGTTAAPQTVTLSNTGGGPLEITSIIASGDFAQSNNCGGSVAAEASCTINVTFTPTATGARTGTVSITSDAPGSPHTVLLGGTGIQPAVALSASSLTFGNQLVGTTSAGQTLTLTNSGTAALNIASIVASSEFAVTHTCPVSPATLAAGSNCALDVTFTPTAAGSRTGVITITDDAPGSPHVVSLSGTGIVGPVVSLSPTSVTFAGNPLNIDCPAKDVTMSNTGGLTLTITTIETSAAFSQANTCGTSLAAGASCTISIQFHPPAIGTTTGVVTITDNAPGSPHTIALTGNGTPPCTLLVSARSATVLRGTDSTSFDISDTRPSCSPMPIELTCSLQNPAACALNPATIPPSGSSTLKVSNLKVVAAELVTVMVEAVSEFRRTSELLTVLISDFAFTRAPERATVRAGESTSYALAIRPVNGLAGTVRLSCSGAPQGARCTVAPPVVTLDGSSLGQATVRVETTARARAGPGTQLRPPVGTPRGLPLLLGLMSLAALATLATRRRRAWVALSTSLLLVLLWAACGGGGLMSTSPGSGTPAGTYMLTITGSYAAPSGGAELTHNTTVTLTVN
jgi:hypothetical protein